MQHCVFTSSFWGLWGLKHLPDSFIQNDSIFEPHFFQYMLSQGFKLISLALLSLAPCSTCWATKHYSCTREDLNCCNAGFVSFEPLWKHNLLQGSSGTWEYWPAHFLPHYCPLSFPLLPARPHVWSPPLCAHVWSSPIPIIVSQL